MFLHERFRCQTDCCVSFGDSTTRYRCLCDMGCTSRPLCLPGIFTFAHTIDRSLVVVDLPIVAVLDQNLDRSTGCAQCMLPLAANLQVPCLLSSFSVFAESLRPPPPPPVEQGPATCVSDNFIHPTNSCLTCDPRMCTLMFCVSVCVRSFFSTDDVCLRFDSLIDNCIARCLSENVMDAVQRCEPLHT